MSTLPLYRYVRCCFCQPHIPFPFLVLVLVLALALSLSFSISLCLSLSSSFSIQIFIDFSVIRTLIIFFRLPDTKVLSFEHNDLHDYDRAHRMGKNNVYCSSAFRDCSISLIELALGRYAKPYNFM